MSFAADQSFQDIKAIDLDGFPDTQPGLYSKTTQATMTPSGRHFDQLLQLKGTDAFPEPQKKRKEGRRSLSRKLSVLQREVIMQDADLLEQEVYL